MSSSNDQPSKIISVYVQTTDINYSFVGVCLILHLLLHLQFNWKIVVGGYLTVLMSFAYNFLCYLIVIILEIEKTFKVNKINWIRELMTFIVCKNSKSQELLISMWIHNWFVHDLCQYLLKLQRWNDLICSLALMKIHYQICPTPTFYYFYFQIIHTKYYRARWLEHMTSRPFYRRQK